MPKTWILPVLICFLLPTLSLAEGITSANCADWASTGYRGDVYPVLHPEVRAQCEQMLGQPSGNPPSVASDPPPPTVPVAGQDTQSACLSGYSTCAASQCAGDQGDCPACLNLVLATCY